MAVTNRRRFVHIHVAWMLAAALVLALLDSLTYELFFVVSLIGFLVAVELTAPFRVTLRWRRRLRWVVVLSLAGFGDIIVRRVIALRPSEVP
jgi:threonine/homoserine efflux transporter RhtA